MKTITLKAILPSEMSPALKPLLVTDLEGLSLCVAFLERTKVFGYDLETNVVNNFTERIIRTIQIGDRNEQFVIDLLEFAGSKDELIAAQGPSPSSMCLQPVVEALRSFLESSEWVKVGHGLQFEYETVRYNLGIRATGFYDTLLAEKQIYAGLVHFMSKGFWGLEDLVGRYMGLLMSKDEQKTFDLETPLTNNQVVYGALDVRLPMGVRIAQLRKLELARLMDSVQIDFDAIPAFGDMKLHGVQTDDAGWQSLIDTNLHRKEVLLRKLDKCFIPVVGTKFVSQDEQNLLEKLEYEWRICPQKTPEDKLARAECRKTYMVLKSGMTARANITDKCDGDAAIIYSSPKKLLEAFRKMGFSKKKMPDTSDGTLENLAKFPNMTVSEAFIAGDDFELPVIDLLRLFRSIDKALSTYGSAWISDWTVGGHRNPVTGRIHSYIDMFGAGTGRTTSSKPNIQNIPKEKLYRHCFTARPGYKVITIDYSGCELRILADMSQEPVWLDAFAKNWDVHSVGAEMLYGQHWMDAAEEGCKYVSDHRQCKCVGHKDLRTRVKCVNFGLAYGLSAKGLSKQLNISYEEAEKLLNDYKRAFPTVMAFLDGLGQSAKMNLETRTIIGTRRQWPKPSWETATERAIEDEKAKAKKEERTPRAISDEDTRWKYRGMFGSIEREGKNAPIQGTNANLLKLAMSLVWKDLEPVYKAFFLVEVHDEMVIECPDEVAEQCRDFVGSCMTEAGAMWVKSLPMTWESNVEATWTK